ncbi:MAG: EamA family transporter [Actinomycetota bacterium]
MNGKIVAGTLLAPVLWGTTYITVTELLPADRPLNVAATRVLPAGLLLAALAWRTDRWRPTRQQLPMLVARSAATFAVFFPLLIVAAYRLPGGIAAAAGGVQPLLVAIIGGAVDRQRPRRRDILVGVAAAAGVAMVVIRPGAEIDAIGVGAALLANVSFAIGVVLAKRDTTTPHLIGGTGWQMLFASVLLVPLALIVEGAPTALESRHVAGGFYLGVIATGVAFVLWYRGIPRLPAAAPPLLGLAAPITGATLGWIVLGESLSQIQLAGFVVTITAITYGALLGSRASQDERTATPVQQWTNERRALRRPRRPTSGVSPAGRGTYGADPGDRGCVLPVRGAPRGSGRHAVPR